GSMGARPRSPVPRSRFPGAAPPARRFPLPASLVTLGSATRTKARMQIGVPKETAPRERRVALAPDSVGRLVKTGARVVIKRDAGTAASFPDSAYLAAGATIAASLAETLADSDVVTKVQRPSAEQARAFKSGAVLVSLF